MNAALASAPYVPTWPQYRDARIARIVRQEGCTRAAAADCVTPEEYMADVLRVAATVDALPLPLPVWRSWLKLTRGQDYDLRAARAYPVRADGTPCKVPA